MSRDKESLTLHIATFENAAELARLIEAIEDEPVAPAEVSLRLEALKNAETTILAFAGERAVGLACLRLLPSLASGRLSGELTELYIERDFQGGEVERALVGRAETLARQRGASQLTLLTGLKNTRAQALYRSLGFADYALAMRKLLAGLQVEG